MSKKKKKHEVQERAQEVLESRKQSFFIARLVLEVLGGNWREPLTLKEIRWKLEDKRVREYGLPYHHIDATELKRILDDLRKDKYVNTYLDDGTKTKYQINIDLFKARFDSNDGKFLKKEEFEKIKRIYYSSRKIMSRKEYKKNKKYINKKEWEHFDTNEPGGLYGMGGGYLKKKKYPW